MLKQQGPFSYLVVGGPNDGRIVAVADGRPDVRLVKRRPLQFQSPDDEVPVMVDIDEYSTLYTVRRLSYRGLDFDPFLAPATMPDCEACRLRLARR